MRHCKHHRQLLHEASEFFCLGKRQRKRLVADNVEACLQGRFGDRKVHVVGRGHRDEVNSLPLWLRLLRGKHLLVGAIGPSGIHKIVGGRLLRLLRTAGEGTGDKFGPVVEHSTCDMHPTDK